MKDINTNSKTLDNKDKHVTKFLVSKVNLKSTVLNVLLEIFTGLQ